MFYSLPFETLGQDPSLLYPTSHCRFPNLGPIPKLVYFVQMASEKATILFCTTIVLGALISGGLAEVSCPKRVMIERGGTSTVSCEVTDTNIAEVYWYKGDPALSSPILQWVNGQPGGTELHTGHYNISNTGAMIITNATIFHEAVYTTFMYFSDDTSDSKAVMINITISPWPPRPIIDACTYEECNLVVNDTGKLTCSIRMARPVITIEWTIISQTGISFVEQPPVFSKDLMYDTWNSSVEIAYGVSSCNQEARFQCVASDHYNLLEYSSSSVRLYTANCTGDVPVSTKTPTITILIIVLVSVVVVAAMVFVICIFKTGKRRNSDKDKRLTAEAFSLISETTKNVQDPDQLHSDEPEITDEEVTKLVMDLKNKYKVSCLFDPLQRNESIKAADLYVGCYCEVRHKNGEISRNSTDKLLTSDVIKKENRVLIDGGSSYGKTMFTKQFVQQWIQSDANEFILLFVPRQEVKKNTELINLVDMQNREHLTKVIRTKNCLLLLDGLPKTDSQVDESSLEEEAKFLPESNESIPLVNLTLSDVLRRLDRSVDSKIQIWVTSYKEDTTDDAFSWPYVKVDVKDVREQQLKDFISKVNRQIAFVHSGLPQHGDNIEKGTSRSASLTKEDEISNKSITQLTKEEHLKVNEELAISNEIERKPSPVEGDQVEENKTHVQQNFSLQSIRTFLEETQIYQEFKETPILLSVIVHIVICDLHPAGDFDDMKIITTEEIVCKLILHIQNAYFKKQKSQDTSKTCTVEETLGRLAMYFIGKDDITLDNQSTDFIEDLNLAIEMRLLQHSRNISDYQELQKESEQLSTNSIHFSHRYLKYYFIANYIVQEEERYTSVLTNIAESDRKAILKFLIHLEHSSLNHLLEALHVSEMDDDMIDCLHNWKNQDNVKTVVTSFNGKEFQLNSLDKSKKHRAAFESFCEKCSQMKIYLKSLSIFGSFLVKFMTSLDIPRTRTLTFGGIEVQESQFLDILTWLSEKDMTLRFLECKMPQISKLEIKREMKKFQNSKLKTIVQPDAKKNATYAFNYKAAKWAKE